jgi:sugar lactone lactonase YvrE
MKTMLKIVENGVRSVSRLLKMQIPNAYWDRGHRIIQWLPLPLLLALSSSGLAQNLFEADEDSGNIYEFTPNGVQSTFASGLSFPMGLTFDSAGNLFVACGGSSGTTAGYIAKITPAGVQSTFVSGLDNPSGLAFDSAGNLFVTCIGNQITNFGKGQVIEITPAGTQSTYASGLENPSALAFDSAGNLFVLVYTNGNLLRHISAGGAIIGITPGGTEVTVASVGNYADKGLAFDSFGDLFVANYSSSGYITEYTPAGSQFIWVSGLDYPRSMAFDSAGNMFVANSGNNSIIEITPFGTQTTFASGLNSPYGLAFQPPPALQAVGAGIQANEFGFTLIGSNNEIAIVEACTNLANPVWVHLATNTLSGGSSYFSDPQWTNYSSRHYRIFSP